MPNQNAIVGRIVRIEPRVEVCLHRRRYGDIRMDSA